MALHRIADGGRPAVNADGRLRSIDPSGQCPDADRLSAALAPDTASMTGMQHDYDVIVIGSGFGGSVSALRLTEKGYRVGVLEAGRRFADDEYATTSWKLRHFLWFPQLSCFGIQRISRLTDALILTGAGVGGGSLVYANTLYRPPDEFYRDPAWGHIADWKAELDPFYDQA